MSFKKIKIEDTADLMVSDDYKERFKAEYHQLARRCENLDKIIVKYFKDELEFEPDTPIELLLHQYEVMSEYRTCLERRAKIEKVKL